MPKTISATAARANFAEIINRVRYIGEEYVVERQGKPVAFIKPIKTIRNKKSKESSI